MIIREAKETDFDAIWEIFRDVVERGETFAFGPETTKERAHSIWMSEPVATYVAVSMNISSEHTSSSQTTRVAARTWRTLAIWFSPTHEEKVLEG